MSDIPRRPQGDDESDERFAARFSAPLKAPEDLGATFEERVMSAVYLAARERPAGHADRGGWWMKPFTVRPLMAIVGALAVAVIAVLATLSFTTRVPAQPTVAQVPPAAAETVHVVRFVLNAPGATAVSVVGDFNAWAAGATPLEDANGAGAWSVSLPLAAGRHEYAFIVHGANGDQWVADPSVTSVADEFGTASSVLHVGDDVRSVSGT